MCDQRPSPRRLVDDAREPHRARPRSPEPRGLEKFVDRYGPRVFQWARAWFQPSDAEEVAQAVFLKLVPAMETFVYQPGKKFRGYLHTATRNAMVDLSKQLGREPRAMGGDVQDALLQREAQRDLGRGWRTSSTSSWLSRPRSGCATGSRTSGDTRPTWRWTGTAVRPRKSPGSWASGPRRCIRPRMRSSG